MTEANLSRAINDLSDLNQQNKPNKLTDPITIWVPAEYKKAWDALQIKTNRRFSKKARKVLQILMDTARAKL